MESWAGTVLPGHPNPKPAAPAMARFIRIGDTLINLDYVRAIEWAGDGRLNVHLSEERNVGLVMRFSGDEAKTAWAVLNDPTRLPVINPPAGDSRDTSGAADPSLDGN